jgi:hypothetical protein
MVIRVAIDIPFLFLVEGVEVVEGVEEVEVVEGV